VVVAQSDSMLEGDNSPAPCVNFPRTYRSARAEGGNPSQMQGGSLKTASNPERKSQEASQAETRDKRK